MRTSFEPSPFLRSSIGFDRASDLLEIRSVDALAIADRQRIEAQ